MCCCDFAEFVVGEVEDSNELIEVQWSAVFNGVWVGLILDWACINFGGCRVCVEYGSAEMLWDLRSELEWRPSPCGVVEWSYRKEVEELGAAECREECTDIFRALQISAYDWRVGPAALRGGPVEFGARAAPCAGSGRLSLVAAGTLQGRTESWFLRNCTSSFGEEGDACREVGFCKLPSNRTPYSLSADLRIV